METIEKINEFIGDMDLIAYKADEKTKAAVERKIQILTEAIIRLDDECLENIRRSIRQDTAAWVTSYAIPTIASMTR